MQNTTNQVKAEQAKWNAVLKSEGLGIIGPEILDFDLAAIEVDPAYEPTVCHIPTESDIEAINITRSLGYAATPEEAGTTLGAISRLANAGLANIRYSQAGHRILAMAGAADADVERAANRRERELADERVAKTLVEAREASRRIHARLERLGGAADTSTAIHQLGDTFSEAALRKAVDYLMDSGAIRRATTKTGFDLLALTTSPKAHLVEAARCLLHTIKASDENRNLARKTFAKEVSGDRPRDNANPTTEEAAKARIGRQFRAAYHTAKDAGVHKSPETPVAMAKQLMGKLAQGPNTFRGITGSDPARGAAILSRLVAKGFIKEIEYGGELGYTLGDTLARQTKPVAKSGGTVPAWIQRKLDGRNRRRNIIRTLFKAARSGRAVAAY